MFEIDLVHMLKLNRLVSMKSMFSVTAPVRASVQSSVTTLLDRARLSNEDLFGSTLHPSRDIGTLV